MSRDIVEPNRVDKGDGPLEGVEETHPAWGMIGASRVSNGPPGATLFDSDIQHTHTVTIRVGTGSRRRSLHRDWLHREKEFLEVEMSEAQWASFVSSMNTGNGVPCTIRRREDEYAVPGMPPEARLAESIDEVRGAAEEAFEGVRKAFEAYTEHKNAANLRTLRFAIENAPSSLTFAADSLTEHAENVVQKARVDIEAMVMSKARQVGLNPGDVTLPELGAGDE